MAETSSISARKNGDARDEILASIRRNLAVSRPFDAVRRQHHGHYHENVSRRPSSSDSSLVENFRTSLDLLGAHFTLAESDKDAARKVEDVIARLSAKRIAVSGSDVVAGVVEKITTLPFIENASAATLFDCDLGITSAQWVIAETGTLVLESERENHRLTSLVPTAHLCIVKASHIRQTLGEIFELIGKELSRTVTFITGASRTSDIELTLTIGVHGPAELYVIVLADQ
jgi:L-lactate utilization protein LutC